MPHVRGSLQASAQHWLSQPNPSDTAANSVTVIAPTQAHLRFQDGARPVPYHPCRSVPSAVPHRGAAGAVQHDDHLTGHTGAQDQVGAATGIHVCCAVVFVTPER